METIKVATRADLKTKAGKPFLKINDNYSCWDSELFGLFQVGNVLDCETATSKDGNWQNITEAKKSEGKVDSPSSVQMVDTQNDAIDIRKAIDEVGQALRAAIEVPEAPKAGYWEWILRHIPPAGHVSAIEPDKSPNDIEPITKAQLDTMRQLSEPQSEDNPHGKNVKWIFQIKKHYPDIIKKAEKAGAKSVGEYLELLNSHQAEVLILEQTAKEETE